MSARHDITRADILPMAEFVRLRQTKRGEISAVKRRRRVEVGPYATFYFENFDTMWWQIHEMLYIEGGGDEQIADEIAAYNPLIPKGQELVATVMFEIEEPVLRARVLAGLGGVENRVTLALDGDVIRAIAEADLDRTTAAGKASSVQFVHFPFSDRQIARFRDLSVKAVLGIDHPSYAHMAVMPPAVREALAEDFDI